MMDIDAIFAADHERSPAERSLPWAETREYCAYADWTANGARARFFAHIDTSGADLIRKARGLIACEIADGHWS